jgi:class I lanthipeptide synthase
VTRSCGRAPTARRTHSCPLCAPDSAFGYRQVVRSGAELTRLDSPGVIDGAAGVALVLTSYADARRGRLLGKDAWDAVFLMN